MIQRTLLFSVAHENSPFSAKKILQIKTLFLTLYEVIYLYYQGWR